MKRIYKAINEGLNTKLIDFDDNGDFKKSKATLHNIKEFCFGDFVLYNPKLGYNNYIGLKVAVCVSDDPKNKLYAVLGHTLLKKRFAWSNSQTKLYNDILPDFHNGLENTKYVLNNYGNELKGTIWEHLDDNEYIPSKEEMITIFDNCKNTELWDIIGFKSDLYWTSSSNSTANDQCIAFFIGFIDNLASFDKHASCHAIALLHI